MNLKHAGGILAASLALAWPASTTRAQGNSPFAAIDAQLQAIQQSLASAHQKLDALATGATANFNALNQGLDDILAALAALPAPTPGMVPFVVQAAGGLCDSGPSPSSNPQIVIDGSGSGQFVVTSILVKSAPQPAGEDDYRYLTVNSVTVDGTAFDTRTGNIFASVDGFGVQESADLMGMPVRINPPESLLDAPRTDSARGGNFPHQIVADSAGSSDIRVQLFCRSDTHSLSIDTVRVSGWKTPADAVSVTYVPGT